MLGGSHNLRLLGLLLALFAMGAPALAAQETFIVTPTTWNPAAGGGTQDVTITSSLPDAPWTTSSSADWLTLSVSLGAGSGSVTLTAAANTAELRTATATIAGTVVTVTQAGVTPTVTVSPRIWNPAAAGAFADFAVTTSNPATNWTVSTSVPWLTSDVLNGTGGGTVRITAAAHTTSANPRAGIATIAGLTVTVTQSGAAANFTLVPDSWNAPAAGGVQGTALTSSLSDAQWTPISNAPWLSVGVSGPANTAWSVKTLAGGSQGFADGDEFSARFSEPLGVAVDANGTVYVADRWNHRIRRITPAGDVTTLAGSSPGYSDGTGPSAAFNGPFGVAVDAGGTLFVADTFNNRIRRITPAGQVTTLAGGALGDVDGTGAAAQFAYPTGAAVDAAGNVYVADYRNNRVRKITPAGVVTTLAGSTAGSADGTGSGAQFNGPFGVAVDSTGNVYVADSLNHRIRRITPAGEVTTLAGSTQGNTDGIGTAAQFSRPFGVAVDAAGIVYVADTLNNRIRRITQAGEVTTLTAQALTVDAALGPDTQLRDPGGVAVDSGALNLYVADSSNHRIRQWIATNVGDASLNVTAAATTTIAARSGTISVGNETMSVTQAGGVPSFSVAPGTWNPPASGGTLDATVTSSLTDAPWTATSNAAWLTLGASGGTGSDSLTVTADPYTQTVARTGTVTIAGQTITVTQAAAPTMALDKTELFFGAINTGVGFERQTSAQIIRLTQAGAGTVSWTATSNQPWLTVSPASGVSTATLTITVAHVPGLPVVGTADGVVTIALTGAANTVPPISVGLNLFVQPMATPAVGVFDTPVDGTANVSGSLALTGWTLDDVEVVSVEIYRDPVPSEHTQNLIFVGDAVFVDGARSDLLQHFPRTPRNTRGGWGYMMLTNMLPNQGNGTFRLYAIATDREGNQTLLEHSPTIVCTNASSPAPFGAIDTPDQGQTVSGIINNFGWVLVPDGARVDVPGGGSVTVYIDGQPVGVPTGWTSRADISGRFPTGFADLGSTLAVYTFDTNLLDNGVHTIAWGVQATNGEEAGVGSRFFTVSNGVGPSAASLETLRRGESVTLAAPAAVYPPVTDAELRGARAVGSVVGRRGFSLDAPYDTFSQGADGFITVASEELDRIELQLGYSADGGTGRYAGYLRAGGGVGPLPIGSRLDPVTGAFTWQPGVGFVGAYDFLFVRSVEGQAQSRHDVRIVLHAKGSGRAGPQIMIDTPGPRQEVTFGFLLAGWAVDVRERDGAGVSTVHAWAYPTCEVPGAGCGDPIFLGAAAYGGRRPDVAALLGRRFESSGYDLIVQGLDPGTYDLAVFAWSTVSGTFAPARTVRVTVR